MEMGSVRTGVLTVQVGADRFELGPGDSITFPSTTPHRIGNEGKHEAVAIWINLPAHAAGTAENAGNAVITEGLTEGVTEGATE
jgi:mannose-6-phosphate isomerase-like protein (cupin superfamily)